MILRNNPLISRKPSPNITGQLHPMFRTRHAQICISLGLAHIFMWKRTSGQTIIFAWSVCTSESPLSLIAVHTFEPVPKPQLKTRRSVSK